MKRWLTPCKLVTLLLVTLSTNNGEKMAAPINLLTRFLVDLSPCSLAPLLPCSLVYDLVCNIFSANFNIMAAFFSPNRPLDRKKSILAKVGFDVKMG